MSTASNINAPRNIADGTPGSRIRPVPNVIVVGQAKAGKTSVVGMLEDSGECNEDVAIVSDEANSPTRQNTLSIYTKTIRDVTFKVIDTVGHNDAAGITAVLDGVLNSLARQPNLVLYVLPAHDINSLGYLNDFKELRHRWNNASIVLLVTYFENESENWWKEKECLLSSRGVSFDEHACITASKGKQRSGAYIFEDEYNESRKKMEDLIHSCLTNPQNPKQHPLPKSIPNVIVFGETGTGKSSVVNMLTSSGIAGGDEARVSDGAFGVSFAYAAYEKTINNHTFKIFDTVGLNEDSAGTVKSEDAIKGLYKLIHQLRDGVSLLVYVMRAPRIKSTAKPNYDAFHDIICQKQVPIVIIITGLEARENMDGWWEENERIFTRHKMVFKGHACITATKGNLCRDAYCYEDEYNESKEKVENLIDKFCLMQPWKCPPKTWFDLVVLKLLDFLASLPIFQHVTSHNELSRALQTYGGLSGQEAIAQTLQTEKHLRARK